MKNILKEELDSIKYLFNYDRNKILSENIESAELSFVQSFTGTPEEYMYKICDKESNDYDSNRCNACTKVIKDITTGQVKNKDLDDCLACEKFSFSDTEKKLDCMKIYGQIEKLNIQSQTSLQKKSILGKGTEQVTTTTLLITGLSTLFNTFKDLFKKEER
jgi:hypothetical protein